MYEPLLQIIGFVGMATLLFVCLVLSRTQNTHYFLVAGQDVLRWFALLLSCLIVGRLVSVFHLTPVSLVRSVNSIIFIGVVGGIIWSVWRHGRATRP